MSIFGVTDAKKNGGVSTFDQVYRNALAQCGPPQNALSTLDGAQADEMQVLQVAAQQGWTQRCYVAQNRDDRYCLWLLDREPNTSTVTTYTEQAVNYYASYDSYIRGYIVDHEGYQPTRQYGTDFPEAYLLSVDAVISKVNTLRPPTKVHRYPLLEEQRIACVLAIAFGAEGGIAWPFDSTTMEPSYSGLFNYSSPDGALIQRQRLQAAYSRAEFLRSKVLGKWEEWSYQGNLPTLGWLISGTNLPPDPAVVVFTRWPVPGSPSDPYRDIYVAVNKSTSAPLPFTINFRPNTSWTVWGDNGTTGSRTGTASSVGVTLKEGDGIVVDAVNPLW